MSWYCATGGFGMESQRGQVVGWLVSFKCWRRSLGVVSMAAQV